MRSDHIVRVAHRGASGKGLAPENTLPAFDKALKLGVDAIEMDVRLTRDGCVVVMHDDTLDRTTDQTGPVAELSLKQLKAADAGCRFDPKFARTRVPTLKEALNLLRGKAIAVVEIKAEGIAEAVVEVIKQADASHYVIPHSFSADTVRSVAQIAPGLPTGLIVGANAEAAPDSWGIQLCHQLSEIGANMLSLNFGAASPLLLNQLRVRGFSVWVWTPNKVQELRQMAAMPVDGIVTDYPNRLNAVLGQTP